MNLDKVLRDCESGERLLALHADDDELHGAARPRAQCEFARIAYGALEKACEQRRELVNLIGELRKPMPCGHPGVCVISTDDDRDATQYCAWCADIARLEGSLEIAADNADGFREMLVKCECEVKKLKADQTMESSK